MGKFKVGDRVIFIESHQVHQSLNKPYHNLKNKTGIIVGITPDDVCGFVIDGDITCYNCNENQLEFEKPFIINQILKEI
jgi:ribosomal protein L21E